jgi:hypothetical protein
VRSAFRIAFIVTAGLALAAAAVLLLAAPAANRAAARVAIATGAVCGVLLLTLYGVAFAAEGGDEVKIADPCQDRELPQTGGIGGLFQELSLAALDHAACEFGSGREELLLALFDDELRDEFEQEHGVDPRSISELGPALLGL